MDETIEFKVGVSSYAWMKDPKQRGLKAGQLLLAPSSNPYADGTLESAKWEKGWREGVKRNLAKTGRPL